MSLTVHPDPQNPAGGYAFLELPGGTLPDEVDVAVFDRFSERWLAAGPEAARAGWQTERCSFGPYPVHRHDSADWVQIGPEIVDRLEEYAPLRLELNGKGHNVAWPDDVFPRVSVATRGALRATAPNRGEPEQPEPPPVLPQDAKPPVNPVAAEVEPEKGAVSSPPKISKRPLWPWILALLLLCAAAAWWFWPRDDHDAKGPDCSAAALAATEGGFAETGKTIRACAGQVTPSTVLRLLEDAAAGDDPDALYLFGVLYDGAELDQVVENQIGLSFDHDAAKAAEYYARATATGSKSAAARLKATCAQLSASDATLAKGAFNDFCQ